MSDFAKLRAAQDAARVRANDAAVTILPSTPGEFCAVRVYVDGNGKKVVDYYSCGLSIAQAISYLEHYAGPAK